MGSIERRTAWSLGDYSCNSYLSELGTSQRRERRKGVFQEAKPYLSGVRYEATRHSEKPRTSIHSVEGFTKMMLRVLHIFKPLKRDDLAKRRRIAEKRRAETLRDEISKAALNIADLTKQLRRRAK